MKEVILTVLLIAVLAVAAFQTFELLSMREKIQNAPITGRAGTSGGSSAQTIDISQAVPEQVGGCFR